MRMMLRATVPVEKGNETFKNGKLGQTVQAVMQRFKPEAAYFGALNDGKRCALMFFDLAEPSQIVELFEPLFLNLDAAVELMPVMNADDLQKGMAKAKAASG